MNCYIFPSYQKNMLKGERKKENRLFPRIRWDSCDDYYDYYCYLTGFFPSWSLICYSPYFLPSSFLSFSGESVYFSGLSSFAASVRQSHNGSHSLKKRCMIQSLGLPHIKKRIKEKYLSKIRTRFLKFQITSHSHWVGCHKILSLFLLSDQVTFVCFISRALTL